MVKLQKKKSLSTTKNRIHVLNVIPGDDAYGEGGGENTAPGKHEDRPLTDHKGEKRIGY